MPKSLLLLFTFSMGSLCLAQSVITGRITDEEGRALNGILIINLKSGVQVLSKDGGRFSIMANANDPLRFISDFYEPLTKTVADVSKSLQIILLPKYIRIKEVEIGFQPTGDLQKDLTRIPGAVKEQKLNSVIQKSIAAGPDKTKTMPKSVVPPEFGGNRIVKGGVPLQKYGYSSDIYQIADWVLNSLGESYFTELKIPKARIYDFILYSLNQYDRLPEMTRWGNYNAADLSKIQLMMETTKADFLQIGNK